MTDIACVIKTEMGHIAVSGVEGQTEVSHGPHASPVMQAWSYLVLLWILTSDCTLVLSPVIPGAGPGRDSSQLGLSSH